MLGDERASGAPSPSGPPGRSNSRRTMMKRTWAGLSSLPAARGPWRRVAVTTTRARLRGLGQRGRHGWQRRRRDLEQRPGRRLRAAARANPGAGAAAGGGNAQTPPRTPPPSRPGSPPASTEQWDCRLNLRRAGLHHPASTPAPAAPSPSTRPARTGPWAPPPSRRSHKARPTRHPSDTPSTSRPRPTARQRQQYWYEAWPGSPACCDRAPTAEGFHDRLHSAPRPRAPTMPTYPPPAAAIRSTPRA